MNLMLGDVQIMCPRVAGPDTAHQLIVTAFDDRSRRPRAEGDGGSYQNHHEDRQANRNANEQRHHDHTSPAGDESTELALAAAPAERNADTTREPGFRSRDADRPLPRESAKTHFRSLRTDGLVRFSSTVARHVQPRDEAVEVKDQGMTLDDAMEECEMNIVVLLIILLLLFGGGGYYAGGPYVGGGLGGLILLILIVMLLTGRV
jgi:hypothetical protein